MSSVFVGSQSSCFFFCSRDQIRQVENRLQIESNEHEYFEKCDATLKVIDDDILQNKVSAREKNNFEFECFHDKI